MIGVDSQLTISITSSSDTTQLKKSKTSLATINTINDNDINDNDNNITTNNSHHNINYNNTNVNDNNKYNNSSYSNNSKKHVLKQHYYTSSEASIPPLIAITKSTPNIVPDNYHKTIEIKSLRSNVVTVNMNELVGKKIIV